MRQFLTYFFRGLIFLGPVAITAWICVRLFQIIDGWLGLPYPGVGFLATLGFITLFGFLASNLFTRGMLSMVDNVLNRVPLVRLVYSSTRDLMQAFVGEKRSFDKPVLVRLVQNGNARAFGFVTKESLAEMGRSEFATVYLPQSYHWAGQLYVFPTSAIERIDASSAEVMAFIVSGGVTDVPHAHKEPDAGAVAAPDATSS